MTLNFNADRFPYYSSVQWMSMEDHDHNLIMTCGAFDKYYGATKFEIFVCQQFRVQLMIGDFIRIPGKKCLLNGLSGFPVSG
jgi:hypothetical protein